MCIRDRYMGINSNPVTINIGGEKKEAVQPMLQNTNQPNPVTATTPIDPKVKFRKKTYILLALQQALALGSCFMFRDWNSLSRWYYQTKVLAFISLFFVIVLPIWLFFQLKDVVKKLSPWNYLLYAFFTFCQLIVIGGTSIDYRAVAIITGMFGIVTFVLTGYSIFTNFDYTWKYKILLCGSLSLWLGACAVFFLQNIQLSMAFYFALASFIWGMLLFDGKLVFRLFKYTRGDDYLSLIHI
eukprot:TRINITY_DN8684_c0_g1_i1.p1 TRINITY_DN8684_c0_g1~~TRINITY_DN8684_c0_g1_i1.p1  ORF type:complete len:252 (+),score=12.57 TRINITY_DN8684_c0_g1_i1:36-758(+)